MARIKFLVFALVAVGLWAYHLSRVSGVVSAQSVAQASANLANAPPAVALRLEMRRSVLQAAALRLAASTAVQNPGPKGPKELPTADRCNAVRSVVAEGMHDSLRSVLVVGIVNEAGALIAQGAAEPGPVPEGFELMVIEQGGAGGTVVNANGSPHLFYAVPLLVSDKNEVRPGGMAFVGLPLLPDAKGLADTVQKELQLAAVGITTAGSLTVASGPDRALLAQAQKLKAGSFAPLAEGAVSSFGPFELPLFVERRVLQLAVHQLIEGTPYGVVAISSVPRAGLEELASYQKFGLAGLLGLLLLAAMVAFLLGRSDGDDVRMVAPPSVIPVPVKKADANLALTEHPHAPEANPDDFHFPAPPPPSSAPPPGPSAPSSPALPAPPPATTPASLPFPDDVQQVSSDQILGEGPSGPMAVPPQRTDTYARPSAPPAPPVEQPYPPPTSEGTGLEDDADGARTLAYPVFRPPGGPGSSGPHADPFANVGGVQAGAERDNTDQTRVASVPEELIQATRGDSATTIERPPTRPSSAASVPKVQSVALPGGTDDDRHFQDVFRDFVATRERCGEPADGLTFERFRAKLLKNKEQLVAKYACRTVRFQVYVKEGKAALKATPVKD